MVGSSAGFDANQARGRLLKEREDMAALQLSTDNHRPRSTPSTILRHALISQTDTRAFALRHFQTSDLRGSRRKRFLKCFRRATVDDAPERLFISF